MAPPLKYGFYKIRVIHVKKGPNLGPEPKFQDHRRLAHTTANGPILTLWVYGSPP